MTPHPKNALRNPNSQSVLLLSLLIPMSASKGQGPPPRSQQPAPQSGGHGYRQRIENPAELNAAREDHVPKRRRLSPSRPTLDSGNPGPIDPVDYWAGNGRCPEEQDWLELEKAVSYWGSRYPLWLAIQGSYMHTPELGITDTSKQLIQCLLRNEQPVPMGTLFDDAIFKKACPNIQEKSKARIVRDISPLIVPPAELLALCNNNNKSYKTPDRERQRRVG